MLTINAFITMAMPFQAEMGAPVCSAPGISELLRNPVLQNSTTERQDVKVIITLWHTLAFPTEHDVPCTLDRVGTVRRGQSLRRPYVKRLELYNVGQALAGSIRNFGF
jgi:hypothetical protein